MIVPVYNVEGYLEDCLESLLAQTYPSFEILLIDDASRDNSGAICDAGTPGSRLSISRKTGDPPPPGTRESARRGGHTSPLWTLTTGWSRTCWKSCMKL